MDIVIIGGIAAGMSAAYKAIRSHKNINITVFEKEDYISFGACGLPYYLGEQFDDSNKMFSRTPEHAINAGIDLRLKHEVLSIDYQNKKVKVKNLESGETIEKSYDKLMIATGATPFIPNIPGVDGEDVYTFTKLRDAERMKNKLEKYNNITIIGGGFIGIEVADQLSLLGKSIQIIQSGNHLANGIHDPEFSEKIENALIEENVKLHLQERVEALIPSKENNNIEVKTDTGIYETDAVVIGVGFRPITAFAGDHLERAKNGSIIVDEYGRTSDKDVFAAGDCASVKHRLLGVSYLPLATTANKLGRIVGENIALEDESKMIKYPGSLGSSYLKVGKYEAASTGLIEKTAIERGFDVKSSTIETNNHSGYYPGQEKISIKLVYDAKTNVIYGGQIFGKSEAVLRAQALSTAIYAGLTTKELGFIDYAYSPPFSGVWEPLNVAGNAAK